MRLRDLSGTVIKTGIAVRTTGFALGQFSSLPLIGPDVRRVVNQAREAGRSAIVSGRASEASTERLAVLRAT